jgi:hypothetical protein
MQRRKLIKFLAFSLQFSFAFSLGIFISELGSYSSQIKSLKDFNKYSKYALQNIVDNIKNAK